MQNNSTSPKRLLMTHRNPSFSSHRPKANSDLLFVTAVLSLLQDVLTGMTQYILFPVLSPSRILRLIHIISISISSRFHFYCGVVFHFVNIPSVFIYLPTDGTLGCVRFWTTLNEVTTDTCVPPEMCTFSHFSWIFRSRYAEGMVGVR